VVTDLSHPNSGELGIKLSMQQKPMDMFVDLPKIMKLGVGVGEEDSPCKSSIRDLRELVTATGSRPEHKKMVGISSNQYIIYDLPHSSDRANIDAFQDRSLERSVSPISPA
jgi:hypothetical protein